MKLTTRGRYATRAMLELATHRRNGPVRLKTLAIAQDLSVRYLQKLFWILKSAQLIRSIRGPSGGYVLARPAEEIRVLDVVEAVEGEVAIVECVTNPDFCSRSDHCPARRLWAKTGEAVSGILGSTTLQNLVRDADKRERMYHTK